MKTTIDRAGRVVIPAALRDRAGLIAADAAGRRAGWHCRRPYLRRAHRRHGTGCRRDVVITDNRRHFLASLRHGIRVETPAEFLSALKARSGAKRRL